LHHEIYRYRLLRCQRRPARGGERVHRAAASAAHQRGARAPARPCWRRKSPRRSNAPIIEWHIKSTTKAQQGLYEYDAVSRLRDSQLGDERVKDISNYIKRGKLWEAFTSEERPILLIDEIDKADIEFPNDLLLELDRMEFYVYETQQTSRPSSARS
jgi:hypothetical protein